MSRGRPETPPSYIVDLDVIIQLVMEKILENPPATYSHYDVDIVIPVYESLKENTAKHITWLLDNKIFMSNKSRFVEYLTAKRGINNRDTFYIYDKFKSDSYSHKNSYKQLTYEVPYVDDTAEPIYIPVYWRVN